jgi:hypothetical protein
VSEQEDDDRRCVVCGRYDTVRWTLDNGVSACVTDLCPADSAQLSAIMEATEGIPPSKQYKPEGIKDGMALPSRTRIPRVRRMEPLNWKPPTAS